MVGQTSGRSESATFVLILRSISERSFTVFSIVDEAGSRIPRNGQGRFAMRRVSALVLIRLAVIVVPGLGLVGCTHNHYYYGPDGPATVIPGGSYIIDDSCELPSTITGRGRTIIAGSDFANDSTTSGGSSKIISSRDPAPIRSNSGRVVISRATGSGLGSNSWRPLKDNQVLTTEVTGDVSVRK